MDVDIAPENVSALIAYPPVFALDFVKIGRGRELLKVIPLGVEQMNRTRIT